MPNIICPKCGKSISNKAVACSFCGYELNENHIRILMPSYDELGKNAEIAVKFIANYQKIDVSEAVARLKKGRIVITSNTNIEQAQKIYQNFAKAGIKVIIIDTQQSKKKKKWGTILCVICMVAALTLIGAIITNYLSNVVSKNANTDTLEQDIINENYEIADNGITIPDVSNISATAAEQILINAGLIPVIEETENKNIVKGNVIECSPSIGSKAPANSRVTIYVSKGMGEIFATSWSECTEDAFFTCELKSLSITDEYLHLICEVNPNYDGGIFIKHTFLGTGYIQCGYSSGSSYKLDAREIPVAYIYDSKEIKCGVKQTIELKVPMSDLESDKTIRTLKLILETNINQPHYNDLMDTYDTTYQPFYVWRNIEWE